MGEHKHNPVIRYLEKNSGIIISRDQRVRMHTMARLRTIAEYSEKYPNSQISQKRFERKPIAAFLQVPPGTKIIEDPNQVLCPWCGRPLPRQKSR